MRYAFVKNNHVTNLVEAEQGFVDDHPDLYDVAVLLTTEMVNIGDLYSGGVFSPPAPTLAAAKMQKLLAFQQVIRDLVNACYSTDQRLNFNAMYTVAVTEGRTNRAAYIYQLFSWASAIVGYSATYSASVNALSTVADVQASQWDLSQIPADPKVNPLVAISIPN